MSSNKDFRTFTIIWASQMGSLLGTAMTRFGLLIWTYEQTGKATSIALLGFAAFITYVVLSPIAGVWVDRLDRRKVLIASDLGAGCSTIVLLIIYSMGELELWHLYLAEGIAGACEAFQIPAYSATVTLLVPREQLARASAMRSLAFFSSRVLAPPAASLLISFAGISGVMVFDITTFCLAVSILLKVSIPSPPPSVEGLAIKGNFWDELIMSFRYIWERPGLRWLTYVFIGMNFFAALTWSGILPAMILARTDKDEFILSAVQSAMGLGGVVGGLVMTLWGGPKRQIHGILAFAGISFMFGDLIFAVGRTSEAWIMAGFIGAFFIPFIVASNRTIWQSKVPPDIQGRVLATSSALQESPVVLGYLITGPIADYIMEPAMQPNGALSNLLGGLIGTGTGAGMGLMFLVTGICGAAVCFGGYLIPALRDVEEDLPDYSEAQVVELLPLVAPVSE